MTGIYGVTNREALDTRLICGGKLRKGAEKRPNAPGADLEYFRFTSDNAELVKAFHEIYGPKPDELEVYFPYPNYEDVFHSARELYGQNHLLKEQCDGMRITQRQSGHRMQRGQWLCEKKCKDVQSRPPCPDCPLKQIGRLSVVLTPLLYAGFPVTITLETHSWNDLHHIASQLAKHEPLTGRAFRVYRQETRIGRPDKQNNKRAATDKWLVRIEPTQETAVLLIQDAQRRARQALLGEPVNVPQLEAGQPLTLDRVAEPAVIDLEKDGAGNYDELLTEDDLPFDAPVQFDNWNALKEAAVERLGYENVVHVTNTLKKEFNGSLLNLTHEAAWKKLVEHQEKKQPQEPPTDELVF